MANPEHLEKLKQGVEVWNKWREEHEEVVERYMLKKVEGHWLIEGQEIQEDHVIGRTIRGLS